MLPKRKTWRNVTSGARGARLHWGQPACGRGGRLRCCQQCRGENNNEIMMLMNFLSSKKYSQSFSWSFLDNWGVCLWRVWLANLGTDWETGFKIWSDFVKDFFGSMIFHLFVTVNDHRLRWISLGACEWQNSPYHFWKGELFFFRESKTKRFWLSTRPEKPLLFYFFPKKIWPGVSAVGESSM